jgi:hypothetical protein
MPCPVARSTQSFSGAFAGHQAVIGIAPGQVADTPQIEHDRVRPGAKPAQQRAVITGRKRRALSACRHVRGAKIIDHVDAGQPRHQRAIAKLAGRPLSARGWRAVQDRLAMKPDCRHRAGGDAGFFQERRHRGRLRPRQCRLGLGEHGGFQAFELPWRRLGQRAGQQRPDRRRIGCKGPWPERRNRLAVGAQQRDVDIAVQHRAGHQADGPYRVHATR